MVAVLLGLLLVNVRWFPGEGPATTLLTVAGAGLLVAAAVAWGDRWPGLTSRPVLWLGTLSFSLYLTHEPLIVSLTQFIPSTPLVLAAGLPTALLVAAAFHRWVELPAHRASRSTARRMARVGVSSER